MSMCVRMCMCMHACMHACMHVCMYACVYARTHVCMYVCMHVRMYVRVYVSMYVSMHVCMYACMYVSMYVCACKILCIDKNCPSHYVYAHGDNWRYTSLRCLRTPARVCVCVSPNLARNSSVAGHEARRQKGGPCGLPSFKP